MSSRNCAVVFVVVAIALAEPDVCISGDPQCTDSSTMLSTKTNVVKAATPPAMAEVMLQHQQQSLEIARRLAAMARDLHKYSTTTRQLLDTFRICGQCSKFVRWGEPYDGGYLMCMDGLNKETFTAAYSLGVEHHDQWSEDVLKNLNVPVNQFDCTVSSSDCRGCNFFKKCIVTADGKHPVPGHESESWTLAQALAETKQSHAAKGALLMKMDIEGSEWPIYEEESPLELQKFGQLIVEFHWLRDEAHHAQYLTAMQNIAAAGFKVAHLHGNNYAGMYNTADGATIPDVLEVTFVHSGARPDGCSAKQILDKLDAENNPGSDELPMANGLLQTSTW